MKIYSIIVFQKNEICNSAYEISDISFFKRSSVKEFLNFFSKTVAENTSDFQKLCVSEKQYLIHSTNNGNLTVVCITDNEYPQRVIFTLSYKIIQEKKTGNLNLDQQYVITERR